MTGQLLHAGAGATGDAEALRPGASLDDFERAAMAEIERREGYEVQLVAALEACRAPIEAGSP